MPTRGHLALVPLPSGFRPGPYVPAGPPLRLVAPPARRRPSFARRRLVAVALLVVLVLAGRAAAGWARSAASAGEAPAVPVVLVAQPGDSYWSLAAELDRGGDIRSTVDELVAANGGGELRVGDRLVLTR